MYKEMLPKKIIDPKASTIDEVAKMYLVQLAQGGRIAQAKVESGEWEEVIKMGKYGRYVKAFRPRRKGRKDG